MAHGRIAHDAGRLLPCPAGQEGSVAPDNERSINLITKLGFVHTGEQWDPDDGRELVYELED